MDPEQRERVAELFELCRVLPKAERDVKLAALGPDDEEIRSELASLLEAYDRTPDFLNQLALEDHSGILKDALHARAGLTPSTISHYRIITYLKRSSSLFIILNVLFLASIVFLPVPVAFFYQYGNQIGSLLVFACTQLVTSVTLLLMWGVARVDHVRVTRAHRADQRAFVVPLRRRLPHPGHG